jgi:pyridoxal phosphate-dependent aminotransferase EpsN
MPFAYLSPEFNIKLKKPRIYLSSPNLGGGKQKYIQEAFNASWIAPQGPNVDAFEDIIIRCCVVNYVPVMSSGTAAIHLATKS